MALLLIIHSSGHGSAPRHDRQPLRASIKAKAIDQNIGEIELLQLDRGEIRVAEYLVELPPREMLEAKLHEAIRLARGQVERNPET